MHEHAGERYVLFGGGGHGRSIADCVERRGGRIEVVVDPAGWHERSVATVAEDGQGIEAVVARGLSAIVAIGSNERRAALARRLVDAGANVAVLIAATSTCAPSAVVEVGAVVLEHAHVGPRAVVGFAAIVNTAAVVEHDVRVGEGTHIAPGAILGGEAACGALSMVGTGAVVLPGVTIGDGVVVGAGAVVTRDVPDGSTVVGVPARRTR